MLIYPRLQATQFLVGYLVPAGGEAIPDHRPGHHQQQGGLPHQAQEQDYGEDVRTKVTTKKMERTNV